MSKNILKKNDKKSIKKNKIIGAGNELDDFGPYVPEVLKNKTNKTKKFLFDKIKQDKEIYQKDYDDKFKEYRTEQEKLLDEEKKALELKIHTDKEVNIQNRHDEIMSDKSLTRNFSYARNTFAYGFYWMASLLSWMSEKIISFIGWLGNYLTSSSYYFIKYVGYIIYFIVNIVILNLIKGLFYLIQSILSGVFKIVEFTGPGIAKFLSYMTDKFTGIMHSISQFIAKASNGPVVVVIIKYVLLILFILLILGLGLGLFGGAKPTFPSFNNFNNPFKNFGYDMFKDKFDYYIGNPLRKGFDIARDDLSGYTFDPNIGGGGISDILSFNPSINKKPNFDSMTEWSLMNFPWKFLELIIPSKLFKDLDVNYKSIKYKLSKIITGIDPLISETIPRTIIDENEGRCDNIYNIDLDIALSPLNGKTKMSIIENYDNNIESVDKKIGIDLNKPLNIGKQVFSIGKPKNIIIELKPEKYINLDYNNLPNSIKNHKFKDEDLSLKDKLKITLPYIEKEGIYILSFNDAYYTNDPNKKIINTNIFKDIDGDYLKARINEKILVENDNLYNKPLYTINN